MKLIWDELARDDYVRWQSEDRKILKRINALINDVSRNGNEGIGKPDALKHGSRVAGHIASPTSIGWSTRSQGDEIRIAAC